MSTGMLDLGLVGPPLAVGGLVLATHVPLGREVLRRGIIFIDLAIAQLAALGVVLAQWLGVAQAGMAVQAVAVTCALIGAVLLHAAERRWPEVQEALIGSVFVLAATATLLVLAGHSHGAEQAGDLLSGQLLWAQTRQLWPLAAVTAVALFIIFGPQRAPRLRFYLAFALAVTASVQLIGVYLVFASLILPALAVRRLPSRTGLAVGYALGLVAYGAGVMVSGRWDLPAGPVVVWALACVGLALAAARWGWRCHGRNLR